jgi:hypothetical protein
MILDLAIRILEFFVSSLYFFAARKLKMSQQTRFSMRHDGRPVMVLSRIQNAMLMPFQVPSVKQGMNESRDNGPPPTETSTIQHPASTMISLHFALSPYGS